MGNPFFEGVRFRRDLAEGQKLEELLANVFGPDELRFLAQETGLDIARIDMTGAPRAVLARVLDAAAQEGKLDAFFARVAARKVHPSVLAGIDAVRNAVGTAPPPVSTRVADVVADVLLVVVTDVERDAVLAAAKAAGATRRTLYRERRAYDDLGVIGGARVLMLRSEMGTSGVGGSLATILTAIDEVHPRRIVMVGIAFGLDPEKQPIGTVLVSKQVHPYELAKMATSAGELAIRPRGDVASSDPTILNRLRMGRPDDVSAEFGLVLSGEKLVDNLAFRTQLLANQPDAIGGEMEGGGLYAAAVERNVPWCIAKAVCDYADGNKGDNKAARQRFAADAAARYLVAVTADGAFAAPGAAPAEVATRGLVTGVVVEADEIDPAGLAGLVTGATIASRQLHAFTLAGSAEALARLVALLLTPNTRLAAFVEATGARRVTWMRHDGEAFSFAIAKAAVLSAPTSAKKLEQAEVLELHRLLIARSFVSPDKIDVLLAGVPPEVVAARPQRGSNGAEQLLALLAWLNDEGPLLHALRNAQAIAMATATKAQKEQFERLLARLA